MEFNHNETNFNDAIGVSDNFVDELANKCSTITANYAIDHNTDSKVTEELMNTFSYEELLFIGTRYIVNSGIEALQASKKKMIDDLISKLDKFKDKFDE